MNPTASMIADWFWIRSSRLGVDSVGIDSVRGHQQTLYLDRAILSVPSLGCAWTQRSDRGPNPHRI